MFATRTTHPDTLAAVGRAVHRHMPVLDGWRGLAILLVIFHNASYVSSRDGSLVSMLYHTTADVGWTGVSLFFVLSGFLITGILLDTLGQPGYFKDFYIRRTLRIFPLYYFVLFVAFVLVPLIPAAAEWARFVERDQIWFWTYLSNWHLPADHGIPGFGHFWSLAVEEQFYLLWPLLLLVAGRRWFPLVAVASIVVAPLIRWWMLAEGMSESAPYQFTIARFDGLAIGALLALAMRDEVWRRRLFDARVWAIGATLAVLAAVVIIDRGLPPRTPIQLVVGQSLVSVLFALFMMATLGPESPLERVSATLAKANWLKLFGQYSYAIYVGHLPIHFMLQPYAKGIIDGATPALALPLTVLYTGVVLGLSYLFALFTWHLFEKRMLLLKKRWAPKKADSPTQAPLVPAAVRPVG